MSMTRSRERSVDAHDNLDPSGDHLDAAGAMRGLAGLAGTPMHMQHSLGNAAAARAVLEAPVGVGAGGPREGRQQPDAWRLLAERSFGISFDDVDLSRDGKADAMGVDAFAQGNQIHLCTSAPDPTSPAGLRLLGHELGHIVQQRTGQTESGKEQGGRVLAAPGLEARADAMGEALAQGVRRPQAAGQAIADTAAPVQCHGSIDHKSFGDDGTNNRNYGFGSPDADATDHYNARFSLTQGDINMLSGDFFDAAPPAEGEDESTNLDNLFTLAKIPSAAPGTEVGTRDEIVCAIYTIDPVDTRFDEASPFGADPVTGWLDDVSGQDGGQSADSPAQTTTQQGDWSCAVPFSTDVQKAVDDRYVRRAADNSEHFADPTGEGGGPEAEAGSCAGGSYRAGHEDAILRAFRAGQTGEGIEDAQMREAAAQHYLEDLFASGHLRTPRTLIQDHWQQVYPNFFTNLKKKLAQDVARRINDAETNLVTVGGSVQDIYEEIYKQIEENTAGLPPFGFGDLVSMIAHDVDNEKGLNVINALGDDWVLFGDGHLDAATQEHVVCAVALGDADISAAYALGQQTQASMEPTAVYAAVKQSAAAPARADATLYAPEQIVPKIDTEKETSKQNWEAGSLDELWNMAVRSDDPSVTYGSQIKLSFNSGEIAEKLKGFEEKFPEEQAIYLDDNEKDPDDTRLLYMGTIHPRQAFIDGFLNPLLANVQGGLNAIIKFSPDAGQASHNTDDATQADVQGSTEDELKGLTAEQRAIRVEHLVSGFCSEEEGETVIQLFSTAPAGDRPAIYHFVEGHPWAGDWRSGLFTIDDRLKDALTTDQLARLRALINQGAGNGEISSADATNDDASGV